MPIETRAPASVRNSDVYMRTGIYDMGSGKAGTLGMLLSAIQAAK